MDREIDLKDISDGKFYGINDMVKADCQGCEGCSACCRGMGNSILLDPLDIFRLTSHLDCSFQELLQERIQLQVVDGVILPNLKMAGEEEACTFLGEDGRCTIHPFRPGLCRLFPLGRCYENGSFRYFLQTHECPRENKAKVKVKKWIDTPQVKQYEEFVTAWHYFLKDIQRLLEETFPEENGIRSRWEDSENTGSGTEASREDGDGEITPREKLRKKICMYVLEQFFVQPYRRNEDFYQQFFQRLKEARQYMGWG